MDVCETIILKMNNQIKKINFNHSFIFFLLSNIFSIIIYKINTLFISPFICFLLILSIGVSHGSLDNIKGKKLLKILNFEKVYIFYLIYIFLASLVMYIWVVIPTISLIIFLIVAAYHFGKEDTQFLVSQINFFNQMLFLLKGMLIVLAPIFFHFDETISIFKLLLIDNETFYLSLSFIEKNNIIIIGIILSTISNIYLFLKNFEMKKFSIFLDYFSILILNYCLSPLLAFTIYFCFLHSIRHSISLIHELDKKDFNNGCKSFMKKAIPLTLLTAVFSFIGLYLLNNNYTFESSILKIIFIGLASLTFPHILLEYFLEKNEK